MIRSRLIGLLGFLLLSRTLHAAASDRIKIDESKIRLEITEKATLTLPVTNTTNQPISTTLQLEFLDSDNRQQHQLSLPFLIGVGPSIFRADVSGFLELRQSSQANYGWLRLKYALPGDAEGIVSISRIAPEPFVISAWAPYWVDSPQYRLQVLVQEPAAGKPLPNMEVNARLLREDRETAAVKSVRTNRSGYAEFTFDLPKHAGSADFQVELSGRVGNFVRRINHTIEARNMLVAITSTDKPIYQPGQKLRVRALVFDLMRNASKGTSVNVSIWDPADDKVFETTLVTSAFGEADTDWEIPDNARLGGYDIQVEPKDGFRSREAVWVGRYDLPNFSIDVRQARPYVVRGQAAEVDIRADYVFGKPLPGAPVRVVREIYRSWNYRELKWDVEKGEVIEGTTDQDGRFHATLGIDKEFEDLTERNSFRDLSYGVYVTDPSTGRTEQRRFWTRVTTHPIHLYVTQLPQTRGMPVEFYVTASYADGTAAICDVEILEVKEDTRLPLGKVTTNKYGVAMARGLSLSSDSAEERWPRLELRARDNTGRTGQKIEFLHLSEEVLRLYTDKPLYRASEPIAVRIEGSTFGGHVVLNASSEGRVVYSTVLPFPQGRADAIIPASKSFRGSVVVSAYHSSHVNRNPFDGRQVLFPSTGELEIEANVAKSTYAPGEEATLTFRVRNTGGTPQESLLGVTIFDKAVEERARTDAEFGDNYAFCRACSLFTDHRRLPTLSRSDLERVDRKQPIPPDLNLAAEVLLFDGSERMFLLQRLGDFGIIEHAFRGSLQERFNELRKSNRYPSGLRLPSDEGLLRDIVRAVDPDFDNLRDPWGNPYHLVSSVFADENRIGIVSSGADETFPSIDDFTDAVIQWPYFSEHGKSIHAAAEQYHQRTGRHIRDIEVLKEELRRQGDEFDAWRDPEGRPFTAEFSIDGPRFLIVIKSAHLIVWTEAMDYTSELKLSIDTALNQFVLQHDALPESHSELTGILTASGISENDLRDPWGHSYYTIAKLESGYFDSVTYTSQAADNTIRIIPVSRQMQTVRFRSAGADGSEGTPDDFTVVTFLRPISEQSTEDANQRLVESPPLDRAHGAIHGAVTDISGALIPGVSVKITGPAGQEVTALTDEAGGFVLRNLDPGNYRVRISLPGFVTKYLTGVLVRGGFATRILATLEVSSVSQNVEVALSSSSVLATSAASITEFKSVFGSEPQRLSTPRLRDYFPETLLWQPALETGADGRAEVRFKLADSMTTWKAVAIASTKDGRIAIAEREIGAFQPFFVEHDPPKLLTEGDQVALPVVVRSYLDRDQSVDLSMKREEWYAPLDTASRRVSVNAGEFTREVFSFKAVKPVDAGRQRITAQSAEAGDAIEKTSIVYPFGREMTQVSSTMFRGVSNHTVIIPPDVLPGTVRAELKIYPNLMAHVVDAIEGIMKRPYGCAEQVVSSAYPGLLYLNYVKSKRLPTDAVAQKSKRYLGIAVQSLRGYQTDDGGFSYWSRRDQPDAAVTAYAIQFLAEAKEFVEFDDETSGKALEWLLKRQEEDGSWQGNPRLTAYIAGILSAPSVALADKSRVTRAVAYLRTLSFQPSEPYVTASIALVALQSGDRQLADAALNILRSEVHYERDGAFWHLQTNTPFYSWGLPGRLETTAVAVRALAAGGSDPELVDKGLLFLLRNKDRYGIWYSTQATVRVLEAFVRLVDSRKTETEGSANIVVNGLTVATVKFGTRQQPDNPVIVDLSKFLKAGSNHMEVVERKKASTATVQLVESHYIPWNPSAPDLSTGPLRYSVRYSKTDAPINDAITVQVEAERIGFRGYGMMLAEIGLPPGAEVDRESMAAALATSGWDLSRYDVLPDRVIVYVWPRAGGTKFEFKFRPRYGLEARTPASKLYDYYNPEAYSILPPVLFKVE